MVLSLTQLFDQAGRRMVAATDGDGLSRRLDGVASTYDLALEAIATGESLAQVAARHGQAEPVDLPAALAEGRV